MSVTLRPINQQDKNRMVKNFTIGKVSDTPSSTSAESIGQPNTAVSESIFGKIDRSASPDDEKFDYPDRYTRVGFLDFAYPILNPLLAGDNVNIWSVILGMKSQDIKDIIHGRQVYDEEKGRIFNISEIKDELFHPEKYTFGAQLLRKLVEEVNLKDRLKKELEAIIISNLPGDSDAGIKVGQVRREAAEGTFNFGVVREASKEELLDILSGEYYNVDLIAISGKYVLDASESELTFNQRMELSEIMYDFTQDKISNSIHQFDSIDILDKLCNDSNSFKTAIMNQIMTYTFILPIGYRPTIEGRVDNLTDLYNELVKNNNALASHFSRRSEKVENVMLSYDKLVKTVTSIFVRHIEHIGKPGKDYKSIPSTFGGKKGLLRGRVEAQRVDFSARTVISCDPEMPIDTIGIPIEILKKVAEPCIVRDFRKESTKDGYKFTANLSSFPQSRNKKHGKSYDKYVKEWFSNCNKYGLVGRQPTLYYLGMQAFKIKPVKGNTIVLSPLIVMPFNADFDGDQMHFTMPQTYESIQEVKEKMAFKKNIWYPKNGEISVVVRHEMQFGLYTCLTKTSGSNPSKAVSGQVDEIYNKVCSGEYNVYDTCNGTTAGVIAFRYAAYGSTCHMSESEIKSKVISGSLKPDKLTKSIFEYFNGNTEHFLNSINKLVKLGFNVANIWAPSVSMIEKSTMRETIQSYIKEFYDITEERYNLVKIGIESEDAYSKFYQDEYKKLNDKVESCIKKNLGEDNGYMSMVKSGANGKMTNLMQIFGFKGRVQKDDLNAFNTIIEGSYSSNLTMLEHFISSYGSRKGIADKVLSTAEPGYLSRKLAHAGAPIKITTMDCHTNEALDLMPDDIIPFISEYYIADQGVYPKYVYDDEGNVINMNEVDKHWSIPEVVNQMTEASKYLSNLLVGRYVLNDNGFGDRYISNTEEALNYIHSTWGNMEGDKFNYIGNPVRLRSPIKCKNLCCAHCYGNDLTRNTQTPDRNRHVGFIASQAIGEPGTQMTMKNFQKGGVVSESNLTSAFKIIEDYFELHDFSKNTTSNGAITYDRISNATGYTKEIYLSNGTKQITVTSTPNITDTKNLLVGKPVILHRDTDIKPYVEEGDSFQKIQGNLNMREVLRYRGYNKAAIYLALKLFDIFHDEDVNLKHFEVMVASMTMAYLYEDTDVKYKTGVVKHFNAGELVSLPEATASGSMYVPTLVGVKQLPKYKSDFFESIIMESATQYIPRAILMSNEDTMTNPITRTAFGLRLTED